MTQGIFNYQVPGRTPATNESNTNNASASVSAVKQYQGSSSNNTEQLSNIQSLIMNLLQGLLQKLGLGAGETPPTTTTPKPDITTLAVGEEDGGIKPPTDVTTLAVGEEDGGTNPPIDVTTYAIGEEDGGIATTQAVGEEDGGIKPPTDVTTLAVGEEDGGGITTKALGEDGGCFPRKPYEFD
ncbi:MAG: hypothetical protein ACH34X_17835 [Thiolinea sp.]